MIGLSAVGPLATMKHLLPEESLIKTLVSALTLSLCAIGSVYAQSVDDHLRLCPADNQFCEGSKEQFKQWFPKAYQKDYQGQRNVSFCLADGCDGAVQKNRPLGCAWRLVIITSGSQRVESTDTGFFDAYCKGKLSNVEMVQMRSQAGELFKKIYNRPLPAGL
jgi:hypothetical protein